LVALALSVILGQVIIYAEGGDAGTVDTSQFCPV
jgi:hypothetical protein